ncbi:Thiosulfate sulfurtransferase PspE precursor [uncultured Roseburia sp.]|nr:Thiosulfate sulfurtransferase PspE precursor [uncultured Roseburia sp.]
MNICMMKAKELDYYKNEKGGILIDLRGAGEYRKDHIPGAVNVPYDTLERFAAVSDKRQLYLLYCDRGIMSLKAARRLAREGYQICALAGGLKAYREWQIYAD